jgi:hypothetical protein
MRTFSVGLLGFLVVAATSPAARASARLQDQPSASSTLPCELTAEDYAVYSAILDDLGKPEDPEEEWRDKSDLILADKTVEGEKGSAGLWGFHSDSRQAPLPQTAENFDARARNACPISPLFKAKSSPRLVSNDEISKLFKKKGDGWKKFYELYPKSSGFWDVSLVGYSDDHLEALVYVGHHCGYLCGTGHLFPLAKENGTWVVKNKTMLWIS